VRINRQKQEVSLPDSSSLVFSISSFIIFAALHFPDTYIKRPHPIFWRIVLGVHSLYLLFITFLLFLPLQEGRSVFKFFDENLGNPLPEINYV